MKKQLLISYVVEAETELEAINHLKALMYYLPEHYVQNFEIFDVRNVEVNA